MKLKTGQVRALNKTLMVAFLVSFLVAPEAALPQTPFYQGKTVTIIQGRDPGGKGAQAYDDAAGLQGCRPAFRPSSWHA